MGPSRSKGRRFFTAFERSFGLSKHGASLGCRPGEVGKGFRKGDG